MEWDFSFVDPVIDCAWLYAAGEVFDQLFEGEPFVTGVVFLEFCDDSYSLSLVYGTKE